VSPDPGSLAPGTGTTLSLTTDDLHDVERVIALRLPGVVREGRRAARMRALVRVTSDLTRTLSTYSRHALVHCQGTAGASDLSEDTRRLTSALEAFCLEIRAVALEYADQIREPQS